MVVNGITPTQILQSYSNPITKDNTPTIDQTIQAAQSTLSFAQQPNPAISFETNNPNNAASLAVRDVATNLSDYSAKQQRLGNAVSNAGPMLINTNNQQLVRAANNVYSEYQHLKDSPNPDLSKMAQLELEYSRLAGWPPVPLASTNEAVGGKIKGNSQSLTDINSPILTKNLTIAVANANTKLHKSIADFQNQFGAVTDLGSNIPSTIGQILK